MHHGTLTKPLTEHLHEFKTQGFTIFPGILDVAWAREMRDRHAEFTRRTPALGDTGRIAFVDILELEPQLTLPAITIPAVLDFAEMIIGPYVQLESITYTGFPPLGKEYKGLPGGWHRDMFASFPQEGVYQRPMLFNAIAYLDGLTDDNGPLRIIPGSHMRALRVAEGAAQEPSQEEILVYPQPGDLVMFHCSLLHSGTANASDDIRYFFCITYNHAWLKYRANYNGPNCQAIIEDARQRNDRRLLRLLGVDDKLFRRANSGYTIPDEEKWVQWCAEDRAAVATESCQSEKLF